MTVTRPGIFPNNRVQHFDPTSSCGLDTFQRQFLAILFVVSSRWFSSIFNNSSFIICWTAVWTNSEICKLPNQKLRSNANGWKCSKTSLSSRISLGVIFEMCVRLISLSLREGDLLWTNFWDVLGGQRFLLRIDTACLQPFVLILQRSHNLLPLGLAGGCNSTPN